MDRNKKNHYYKHIVKRQLSQLKTDMRLAKDDKERQYYCNRYAVQLRDFAKALHVQEKHLDGYIHDDFIEVN